MQQFQSKRIQKYQDVLPAVRPSEDTEALLGHDKPKKFQELSELSFERRRNKKSQSVFVIIFFILVSYIVLDVILPNDKWKLSFEYRTSENEISRSKIDQKSKNQFSVVSDEEFANKLVPKEPNKSLKNESAFGIQTSSSSSLITDEIPLKEDPTSKSSLNLKAACQVPRLNPFDNAIKHLITKPAFVNCTDETPLLFESTLNFSLVSQLEKGKIGLEKSCCYQSLQRKNDESKSGNRSKPDDNYSLSDECFPINASVTAIPAEHEFLVISCKNIANISAKRFSSSSEESDSDSTQSKIMDMHAFVPEKPSVEKRIQNYYEKLEKLKKTRLNSNKSELTQQEDDNESEILLEEDKLNVVMLGIDAVSHMNFIRFMPETFSFLKNNLSAIEMQSINKIGDNTYPIMAATLTGQNQSTLEATCVKDTSFDDCPFIWKKYAAKGYRTSYGEDSTWMGIFNYMIKGFKKPPTDYYLRPFGVAAESLIASHRLSNANLCYGPRLTFEVLLDYLKKFAFSMGHNKRYFQLIWGTSLTHDILNYGRLGDKHLLSTLKWFHEEGYLNNTAFILMSDHGIRWGDIQHYLQGQLEGRLPFLYYVFPPWFKKKYSRAMKNLQANQERLSTHFDLYEVLFDLLDLNSLSTNVLEAREKELEELSGNSKMPRGISQFLPIPLSRTCQMADISEHFCTCHRFKVIDKNRPEITQAANYIVHNINLMISHYSQCGFLTLAVIETASEIESDVEEIKDGKGYHLTIVTSPGNGLFEASVLRTKAGVWSVSGVVTRNNLYGNQSHCVDNKELKLYCYCIDDIIK